MAQVEDTVKQAKTNPVTKLRPSGRRGDVWFGGGFFNYPSVEEVNDTLCVLFETGVVADHADSSTFPVEFAQQLHDRLTIL